MRHHGLAAALVMVGAFALAPSHLQAQKSSGPGGECATLYSRALVYEDRGDPDMADALMAEYDACQAAYDASKVQGAMDVAMSDCMKMQDQMGNTPNMDVCKEYAILVVEGVN